MPSRMYSLLAHAFPKEAPPSLAKTHTHVSALSGVEPILFDCCINSCCCYTVTYADVETCPFCNEPRYDSQGRSYSHFTYIPLLPRLVALYSNQNMAEKMRYRASYDHQQDRIGNIFDGHIYQDLRKKEIEVDGQRLCCCYFSDPRDIALGPSTDGFASFR